MLTTCTCWQVFFRALLRTDYDIQYPLDLLTTTHHKTNIEQKEHYSSSASDVISNNIIISLFSSHITTLAHAKHQHSSHRSCCIGTLSELVRYAMIYNSVMCSLDDVCIIERFLEIYWSTDAAIYKCRYTTLMKVST